MKLLELEQLSLKRTAQNEAAEAARKQAHEQAQAALIESQVKPLVVKQLAEDYTLDADELAAALSIEPQMWWEDEEDGVFLKFATAIHLPDHDRVGMVDCRASRQDGQISVKLSEARLPWYSDGVYVTWLEEALVNAALAYQRDHERMQARADEEVRNASRAARQFEAKQLEDEERQALCNILSRDPVAYRLLQAFIAIQDQRAAWEEQLDAASNSMADIEARYGERLSRAEQTSRDAQREAENARYETTEAKDTADHVQRKLDKIERRR